MYAKKAMLRKIQLFEQFMKARANFKNFKTRVASKIWKTILYIPLLYFPILHYEIILTKRFYYLFLSIMVIQVMTILST